MIILKPFAALVALITFAHGPNFYNMLAPAATASSPTHCVNITHTGTNPARVDAISTDGHSYTEPTKFNHDLIERGCLMTGEPSTETLAKVRLIARDTRTNKAIATIAPSSCATKCIVSDAGSTVTFECYDPVTRYVKIQKSKKNPFVASCNSNQLPRYRSKPRF